MSVYILRGRHFKPFLNKQFNYLISFINREVSLRSNLISMTKYIRELIYYRNTYAVENMIVRAKFLLNRHLRMCICFHIFYIWRLRVKCHRKEDLYAPRSQ